MPQNSRNPSNIQLKTSNDSLMEVLITAVNSAKIRFRCVSPFVTADALNIIVDRMKQGIDYRLITRLNGYLARP